LDAFAGAGLEVEGWVGAEEIDDAVGACGHLAGEDLFDGAVALGEGQGFDRGGDLDAVDFDKLSGQRLLLRGTGLGGGAGGLLGEDRGGAEQEQGEAGEWVLHGSFLLLD
jgi:hypothetical protein